MVNDNIKDRFLQLSLLASSSHSAKNHFCTEGITLQILEDLLEDNPESMKYKTKEVVCNIFVPLTRDHECSLLEHLKGKQDSCGNEAVGKLDYFVSYSWKHEIGDLVQALKRFETSTSREQERPLYFFIDSACINQYKPMSDLLALDMIIARCRGLVTIITNWENPVPFTRAWCLLEMSLAIGANVKLHGGNDKCSNGDV